MKRVLIGVPCYNEEENIKELFHELNKVRSRLKEKYEINYLFVDDGSRDLTAKIIKELSAKNDFVYYRVFAKNSGHQAALRAAIDSAQNCDALIMMDADLQHPPEHIPKLIEYWSKDNFDIVQMVRNDTVRETGFFKFYTSKLYYGFINKISGLTIMAGASDFRLIDKKVISLVSQSKEVDLFLRGYFNWLKLPTKYVEYKPAARFSGQSKYTFKKMLNLAGSGVIQFSERPLRLSVGLGAVMSMFALIYAIVILVRYITGGHVVSGWLSIMLTILFCFGANFIILGIVGTYLSHALAISKKRPQYIIDTEKLPES